MTQSPEPPYGGQPQYGQPQYGQPSPYEQAGSYNAWPPTSGGVPAVQGYGYAPQLPPRPPASGLYTAAAIINWVVLALLVAGTCGIGLIAAAWFVPMTIYTHKGARDRYKHTALGVCTLLFCNLISGILMLVEDGNRQA